MTRGFVVERRFGRLPDGEEMLVYELCLANGNKATICELGAALVGLTCPDRDGASEDIVLACGDAPAQFAQNAYFGAVIGRCAGRISEARIVRGNRELALRPNHGRHQMHGGPIGLSRLRWHARIRDGDWPSVRFEVESADGDEGYPGNLRVAATWTLAPPCRLSVEIEASCDAPTPFNPTIHPYFNLDGHASGTLEHHRLSLAASRFTPIGTDLLPTGKIEAVDATPFDFRQSRPIGADPRPPLRGYDHNFVIDHADAAGSLAACLESVASGRRLTLSTDRSCLHLYTGGSLDGIVGKDGAVYERHAGMCLEPQGFPDMYSHEDFPDDWLLPGTVFRSRCLYALDVSAASR
ncbi:aldose epimerase family protein [Sphingopyxis sp.]|jgi:aldose 1-epimerase|uniref:aldose epimerase family protein n=1 Tax=Sphingopyxis sp. TaxID=1908224 RepID=UPI002DF66E35|nr:aldose epimerase family protein [Sphingopyxis sp.]